MTKMLTVIPRQLLNIMHALRDQGGKPYVVGGAVRDYLMGKEPKDFDVEVYGLSADGIIRTLEGFSGTVHAVGKSFGVILFKGDTYEVEFSLPRRENKEGQGHKGFMVEVDPTMTVEEAASRRDFTINSIMIDPFTGELIDTYQGLVDLIAGILRPVSEKFVEDPLRVLRAMQFAGRFNMHVSEELVAYSRSLVMEYEALSKERIWWEWKKWALKSTVPSAGLTALDRTTWLMYHYPELNLLKHTLQDPIWHPEGDAFAHTKHCLDYVAIIAERTDFSEEERLVLMFAVLLHDVGKPLTTQVSEATHRIIAPGHDKVGGPIAQEFLEGIGAPNWLIEQVVPLVQEHMIRRNDLTHRSVRRLSMRLDPASIRILALVIEADMCGRPPRDITDEDIATLTDLLKIAQEVEVLDAQPKPILMGRHLIEHFNMKPGPVFGEWLDEAFEAQLEGDFEDIEGALTWFENYLSQKRAEHGVFQ